MHEYVLTALVLICLALLVISKQFPSEVLRYRGACNEFIGRFVETFQAKRAGRFAQVRSESRVIDLCNRSET